MLWAKQSTAATLIVGPILDASGVEYTGAVIGDLSLSKNGATLTALASAASLTHIANGQYTLVLTTGNTDTIGRAQITCNKAGYQTPMLELMVLQATVYDALVTNPAGGLNGLPLSKASNIVDSNVISVGPTGANTTQTARDIGLSVLLAVGTGTGQVNLSSGKVPATLASTDVTGNVAADLQTVKTQTVTCAAGVTVSPFVGSTGAAVNGTTVNTLAGHDPGATLGTSTLTQTQVTGGAYALNSASFGFNAAMDFTTTQKAATLARVTLVDTTTTNTDMRGTDNAALAATALSTAVWTSPPTGFLAATFPTTVASTTNITTVATVTNLTNAPTSGDLTATMKTSVTAAATAATPTVTAGTVSDKTGYSLHGDYDAAKTAATQTSVNAIPASAADAIWDELRSGHTTTGTFGATSEWVAGTDVQTACEAALTGFDFSGKDIRDVTGKVLGGGAGTITGTGVRAVDSSGNAIAPASATTALLTIFTGITSLAQWLGLIAGKQVGNTTARTELRATGAGSGTFDETTDSTQAIADAIPTAAANFAAVLTTQLTESYAADGTAPTLAQAIFLIQQSLHEFAISGTTRTVKKLDGSTTAATFTLDDASAPTSTTRAT